MSAISASVDALRAALTDLGVDVISFSFIAERFGVPVQGCTLAHFQALSLDDLSRCGDLLISMRALSRMKDNVDWAYRNKVVHAIVCLRLKKSIDERDEIVESLLTKAIEALPVKKV